MSAIPTQEPAMITHSDSIQLLDLGDDLCCHILSFIADAPLEERLPRRNVPLYRQSTLGLYLPLVCSRFHNYANSDLLWSAALLRQIMSKKCWKTGFKNIILLRGDDANDLDAGLAEAYEKINKSTDVRKMIRQSLGEEVNCKHAYQMIVEKYISFSGPMFIMPSSVQLGQPYGLHLFEPRYVYMLDELLANFCNNPEEAKRGAPIEPKVNADGHKQAPHFIHACKDTQHLTPGMTACLVELVRTRVYGDGSADVFLLPVGWVQLDQIWNQPSAHHLFYAASTRI